jgi:thiol-disulfide isomerase/thioredoxin
MGKASSAKQGTQRRERIAAQRAAARRQEIRNRLLIAGGAVIAVVAIVVAFVVIKANNNSSSSSSASASGYPAGSELASIVDKVTSVPESTLRAVGSGTVASKPQSITGPLLRSGGRPEMLYMGAEYCPYCAAERWAMIVALSRFGTFTGLQPMESSSTDVYANTPTFTFANAKYTSKYVTFTTVELENRSGGTLQTPTPAEQALMNKYDAPPHVPASDAGSIPFVSIGNRYLIVGASYDPAVLSGLTWSQIASDLHDPSTAVAKGVNGTANYITAALCKLTNDHPGDVCTSAVTGLQGQI